MSRRWIFPAVVLVLVFTASLVHVEPGTLGILRSVAGGRSFVLEPGLRLRIPFLQVLLYYPSGPFRLDFEVTAPSRDGTPVGLAAHFEGRLLRETLVEFSRRAGPRNGPTLVEEDLRSFVTRWAAGQDRVAIPPRPMEIRDRFSAAARANGFEMKTLTVALTPKGPPPSTLEETRP